MWMWKTLFVKLLNYITYQQYLINNQENKELYIIYLNRGNNYEEKTKMYSDKYVLSL